MNPSEPSVIRDASVYPSEEGFAPPPPYQETDKPKTMDPNTAGPVNKENKNTISININSMPPTPAPVVQTQPQPQQQPRTVHVVQAIPVQGIYHNLAENPCTTTCTNCQQRITTNVVYKAGTFSWVMCIVFVIFGLVCGCCILPFFAQIFLDAHHSCPLCNQHLGIYKRM